MELEILSQHAISIREKIIHMIPLHYLSPNEEKYIYMYIYIVTRQYFSGVQVCLYRIALWLEDL